MTKPSDSGHDFERSTLITALALALVAAGVGLWSYLSIHPYVAFPFDDSYITQVFARNLFVVGGLSFDGFASTPGATGPMHIALLAVIQRFVASPLSSALFLGILCHLITVSLYTWLLVRLRCSRWVVVGCGLLLGSNGFLLSDALNGLETSLFHALAAGAAVLLIVGQRPRADVLLGLLLGALVGTRPEGIFVAGGFLVARITTDLQSAGLLRRKFGDWAGVGIPLALIAAVARWNDITLGSTGMAKLYLWGELGDPLSTKAFLLAGAILRFWLPLWYWVLPIILAGEYLFGLKHKIDGERKEIFRAWGIAAALFYIAYFALSPGALVHLDFRYQHILLPPVLFIAALYIDHLTRAGDTRARRWIPAAVAFLFTVGLIHGHWYSREMYGIFTRATRNGLLPTTEWIQKNTPRDASIAAHDIGGVGFHCNRTVMDLSGIANSSIRPFVQRGEVRAYLEHERPDYVVVLPDWAFVCLGLDPAAEPEVFSEAYRSSVAYDGPYVVYRCDWPSPGDAPS